jgi:hypothetical protein
VVLAVAGALVVGGLVVAVRLVSEAEAPPQPAPEPIGAQAVPEPPVSIPVPPTPVPAPTPAVPVVGIRLPDGLPAQHAGFERESLGELEIMAGVVSYFVGRYRGDGEVSVRFLGLDAKTSPKFIEHLLEALGSSGSVKKVGTVELPEGSGWDAAALYARDEAGIFVASNRRAVLVVSGPTPDQARVFGLSLKFAK